MGRSMVILAATFAGNCSPVLIIKAKGVHFMKVIEAFQQGAALVARDRKIIGVIYILNLCIAALFAIPLFVFFNKQVSALTARDELAFNMNYSWWSSFQFSAKGLEETIRPVLSGGFGPLFDNFELLLSGQFSSFGWMIFLLGIGYIFLAAFFNGGAIAFFADERKVLTMGRFFSNAGAFFNHMAALASTTLLLFFLFHKLINPAIFSLVDAIVGDTLSQSFAWFVNLIGYLIIFDLVFLFTLILDYAKIIVISEKKESSWLCIWLAVKFIFSNFLKTIGLNILLLFFGALIVGVGGGILSLLNPSNILLLIAAFIVQQLVIVAHIALRLTFYASETVLYQSQTASETPVKKRKRR
jgi:hypothetical protein